MAKAEKMNRAGKGEEAVIAKRKGTGAPHEGHYGTRSTMLVQMEDISDEEKSIIEHNEVIAQDEKGKYITTKDWIDARALDPNRMYRREDPSHRISMKKDTLERLQQRQEELDATMLELEENVV